MKTGEGQTQQRKDERLPKRGSREGSLGIRMGVVTGTIKDKLQRYNKEYLVVFSLYK